MSETAKASAITHSDGLKVGVMRSQLGRVRGLGTARSGTGHWWAERVTSIALIPLTVWFVFSALHLAGLPRLDMAHWAANPINATLLLATVVLTFHHTQLGLQVVIEDYVHVEAARMISLLAVKGICFLLGLAGAVSVLKLAFIG